ncbi:MAG: hypothetical protein M3082_12095 [Candidatus Dormibacteraeota bacterium]|nr:hypothetical protein [Candidatus Dormibacteraeota bacterium]
MDFDRLLSRWWQPETPGREYAGQISHDADGATAIELVGTLSGTPFPMHDPEPEVLHGLGKQGPLFTARKVMRSGASMGMPGFATEVFRPRSLLVGAHVDETTLYDEALLETTFLTDWLHESGIRIELRPGADAQKGSVAVSYQSPVVRTSHAAPGVTVTTWTSHQGHPMRSGYGINETVALKVALETAIPVDDLIEDYVTPLLDLVSFGTGRSNAVDRLMVRSPSVTWVVGDKTERENLEFLTEWIAKPVKNPERLSADHMNFAAADAAMGFDELVRRWFALYQDLRPSLAPYFGLVYAPPTHLDLRLVSISQALEAYHRASKLPRGAMSKEEFAKFKEALLDACPEKHTEFLKQKLGYLNELSQVERTNQLVERAKVALRTLLPTRPSFAVDFIDARNAKTHPDQAKTRVGGLHMYDLTATATYLFEACIMLDLGFDETVCAELFERQPQYRHLAANPPHSG